jgi:hypothetical protein
MHSRKREMSYIIRHLRATLTSNHMICSPAAEVDGPTLEYSFVLIHGIEVLGMYVVLAAIEHAMCRMFFSSSRTL